MAKTFADLEIWQRAIKLAEDIYDLTRSFPKTEQFALIDQIKRAVTSISANIAEAFGRFHYNDKRKFLFNARGSLQETKSHLLLSAKLFKLKPTAVNPILSQIDILGIKLNNFINAIGKSQSK
ncbi:MAG: four helix bundle protein [Candidatus Chisholmbacteria bacterium]|nr:four helix bundle protein [Candidatus Chisholmbacteria bacterium]